MKDSCVNSYMVFRNILETIVESLIVCATSSNDVIELLQLRATDGSLHVGNL